MSITQYNSSVRQMSQSKFNSMKNASGKIPDLANQIVMTNSEDTNISCLRTEVVYDMTSSDANINWGYTSGIGNGVTINKDFSKYNFLVCEYLSYNNSIVGFCDLSQPTVPSDTTGRYMLYAVSYVENGYNELISVIDLNKSSLTTYLPGGGTRAVKIAKIYGILKTPSMIYTGHKLFAGNGISLNNGIINASSMTTLWTNPNPTNAFPAQTITLNSDDYDYLIIRCSGRRPYNSETNPIWQTYMIKKGDVGFNMFVVTTSSTSEYRGEIMDRVANNITPTSIHFENAGYMQNSTTNAVSIDYVMIPQQVIGVKVV